MRRVHLVALLAAITPSWLLATAIRFEFIGASYDWTVQHLQTHERHATPAELWDFLAGFGFDPAASPAANAAAVASLFDIYPPTHFMTQPNERWLLLGTASGGHIFNLSHEYVWDDDAGDMTWRGYAWTGAPALPPDIGSELYGHWIATVPEPAATALVAALAGLGILWRGRRAHGRRLG